MSRILITQATIVNEGQIFEADVLLANGVIEKIGSQLDVEADQVIDAAGMHLLPGFIDDQVHFRDPGVTYKGSIATESKAALAGGTTSFMDMPNVKPSTTTIEHLEAKYQHASEVSWLNYSFYLGATNDNIEEVKALDPTGSCGVKIFMGASTGNMLVDREQALTDIFTHSPTLITTHCEDTPMIKEQEAIYREKYGEDVPMIYHPDIRCREACYKSSSFAVDLAKKTGADLHVLHLTTAEEMALFEPGPVEGKKITAEACVHHLWFSDADYETKGSLIKCNPAVKKASDRDAIRQAVREGRIDIIATDHAPHTWDEKQSTYFDAPAGLPQVQQSLSALLDLVHQGVFDLPMVVQKIAHNVAIRYQIDNRGFIREGYAADLVLVDMNKPHVDRREDVLYKCGWSPWEGHEFKSSVIGTIVNGELKYYQGEFADFTPGQRLRFNR
ncbi:dihydroorotase [Hydrogenovibrio sp. JE_KL2]|uniref:dihydroorotase n=1 Tax=Hydrogenovibrio sp. JE_KL2 TaxID=2651188 RepID=UPI00128AE73D|nr:dihydroorotase [Hydrogenovibrio sp. JE_KL2]MBN2607260.1 dihydroorotase [Thiotrichales bacterium]MPQ76684.1 dihydroorotase [Hydrogenovibrio sp. JE_KL2]